MSDLLTPISIFHFIRPWWLLLIPLTLLLWWRIRSRATVSRKLPSGIATHLASALQVGSEGRSRILPIDGVATALILLSLATAGPTWSRVPHPLVAQTAPLAVVLNVSKSMMRRDVAPSRLERAKHKILDLLETRSGARTALIAYAGTAHRVTPLSEDAAVLKPFLTGLSPDVMPKPGNNATAALTLANETIETEEVPGAILFVTDGMDPTDLPAFEKHAASGGVPIVFLKLIKDASILSELARMRGSARVELTTDGGDVSEIARRVALAYRDALAADDRQRWNDRGWMLVWPLALLVLLWFRKGWTMPWSTGLVVIAAIAAQPQSAYAGGLKDWFLTLDQQGRLAFEKKQFPEAASLFQDPEWKGYALYTAGKYKEAVAVLETVETAPAAFTAGLAHLKSRGYREAIAAFKTALERKPHYPAASRNLEIARAILEYVESTREQSGTGERGVGADDVVYDNKAKRGDTTTITQQKEGAPQTEAQWMRTVQTQTADFLRSRFALEDAKRQP